MLLRNPENPLISPRAIRPALPGFEVIGTFNAGACLLDGEIILLLRVAERPVSRDDRVILCPHYVDGVLVQTAIHHDDPAWDTSDPRKLHHRHTEEMLLTSISHLRLARSQDGIHFEIMAEPWLLPDGPFETFGMEDARITCIDARCYVNYTAVSPYGIATGLVSTADFVNVERHGLLFPPANRDVTLFPERIQGEYVCYHRPMPGMFGGMHIWMATSPDLRAWGNHRVVLPATSDGWMNGRVGGGAPPIRTDAGWLSIFHAADQHDRYCLGAYLAALDDPGRIIARSEQPILIPEAPYETDGFFGNVVFTCGAVEREGEILVYYGAADEHIALATIQVDVLVNALQRTAISS